MDRESKILLDFIEKREWGIFNGTVQGDKKKQYKFTGGKGNTVIDYDTGDIVVRVKIKKLTVEDRVDSDHPMSHCQPLNPIEVWLENKVNKKRRGGKSRKC